jgi:hypothetical protein
MQVPYILVAEVLNLVLSRMVRSLEVQVEWLCLLLF